MTLNLDIFWKKLTKDNTQLQPKGITQISSVASSSQPLVRVIVRDTFTCIVPPSGMQAMEKVIRGYCLKRDLYLRRIIWWATLKNERSGIVTDRLFEFDGHISCLTAGRVNARLFPIQSLQVYLLLLIEMQWGGELSDQQCSKCVFGSLRLGSHF